MTELPNSVRRPGRRPDNSKRITNDADLPPSMVKELKKAGVFRLLGITGKDAATSENASKVDLAARRYLHVYQGGISGYPLAEDQRETAKRIGRRAKNLSKAIVEDPEVSKRFFLALKNHGDQKLVGAILKAGPKQQDKEQYLQRLLNQFVNASDRARVRSRSTKRRTRHYDAEVNLAGCIFNENVGQFKSHRRRKSDGRVGITKGDRELLEQLVAGIMKAALMVKRLKDPISGEKIEEGDVYSIAAAAVEKLAIDYGENSHEWTAADAESENEISKDRWYPKRTST